MEVMTAFAICMVLLLILLLVGVPLPYCFAGALTFMVATCGFPSSPYSCGAIHR